MAESSPDYAHLALPALRAYRRTLIEEEERVSYWRRILQARLDLLNAGDVAGTRANAESLRRLLTGDRIDRGRQVLLNALPVDDFPPLPELNALWAQDPDPGDSAHTTRLVAELAVAERQLSDYRNALHRRLSMATGELIIRYRRSPLDCLTALPELPEQTPPSGA